MAPRSVAAVSVAAHECGHAIQHQNDHVPLKIRGALVPIANFGAGISWPLIVIGILMGGSSLLINIGIWMFVAVVAFHLVTLPVEFNASSRALKIMESSGILHGDENRYAKEVLGAAGFDLCGRCSVYDSAAFASADSDRGFQRKR